MWQSNTFSVEGSPKPSRWPPRDPCRRRRRFFCGSAGFLKYLLHLSSGAQDCRGSRSRRRPMCFCGSHSLPPALPRNAVSIQHRCARLPGSRWRTTYCGITGALKTFLLLESERPSSVLVLPLLRQVAMPALRRPRARRSTTRTVHRATRTSLPSTRGDIDDLYERYR